MPLLPKEKRWRLVMIRVLKDLLKRTFVYDLYRATRPKCGIEDWERMGRPIPPPHSVKQAIVRNYADRFAIRVLVETGTYVGDMVNAMCDRFDRVYSIELDGKLCTKARRRFAKYPHIHIIHGDSATVLSEIMKIVEEPCLLWLDAHYSGGITAKANTQSPIVQELVTILEQANMRHVILIDDARCFTGRDGYPTIEELRSLVWRYQSERSIEIETDIIRIY